MPFISPRVLLVRRLSRCKSERARRKSERAQRKSERASSQAEELGVKEWLREREHLKLGRELGAGSFGVVYSCTYDGDETSVAKELKLGGMSSAQVGLFKNEVQLWAQVAHENIVEFRGVIFGDDSICYLLLEHMTGGSLHERLESKRICHAPFPTVAELSADAHQIASAMAHLHSRKIIHRDLKTDNVLVAADGRLCVGDFGLARICTGASEEHTAETGTYRFMAPEVMRHEGYGPSCDVYSFAVMCWSMYTYHKPYGGISPVTAALAVAKKGLRPAWPPCASRALVAICERCWHQDPARRPTFDQVLAMLELLAPLPGRNKLTAAMARFDRALPSWLHLSRGSSGWSDSVDTSTRGSADSSKRDSLDSSTHSQPPYPRAISPTRADKLRRKKLRSMTHDFSAAQAEVLGGLDAVAEGSFSKDTADTANNLAGSLARDVSKNWTPLSLTMPATEAPRPRRRHHSSHW